MIELVAEFFDHHHVFLIADFEHLILLNGVRIVGENILETPVANRDRISGAFFEGRPILGIACVDLTRLLDPAVGYERQGKARNSAVGTGHVVGRGRS